jgi:transposase
VASEALRGRLTAAQRAAKHGFHQTIVGDRKRLAMEGQAALFSAKSAAAETAKAVEAEAQLSADILLAAWALPWLP